MLPGPAAKQSSNGSTTQDCGRCATRSWDLLHTLHVVLHSTLLSPPLRARFHITLDPSARVVANASSEAARLAAGAGHHCCRLQAWVELGAKARTLQAAKQLDVLQALVEIAVKLGSEMLSKLSLNALPKVKLSRLLEELDALRTVVEREAQLQTPRCVVRYPARSDRTQGKRTLCRMLYSGIPTKLMLKFSIAKQYHAPRHSVCVRVFFFPRLIS